MSITHHPDIASLMCCAAGSQPEAFAAVIASHLACCPTCRAEVARMQSIGSALFEALEPCAVSVPAPVVAMRAAEQDGPETTPDADRPAPAEATGAARAAGSVPYPLAGVVGPDLDAVAWRWVAPGIAVFPLPLSKGCAGTLRLIKVAPGKRMPEHAHEGSELTLIVRGSYTDATGTYRPGDVADLDDRIAHSPVACPEQGCICLTASDGKMRFKGWLPRLLQPLVGL